MRNLVVVASKLLPAIVILGLASARSNLSAQEASKSGQEPGGDEHGLTYQRRVQVPQAAAVPEVVVTEFFTHGELDERAGGLAVFDGRRNAVPWRVLQVGPGDFCRVAFQTVPKERLYKICYGGKGEAPRSPDWTSSAGLLLETRRFKNCDLNNPASLREAFASSNPYGSGFVPSVFHRFNPFWPDPGPFLSEYRGTLQVTRAGLYRFFTSSQDASFLSIDAKPVVAAPGWHGPVGDARFKGEINLSAGPHAFLYLHAAAGTDACMVAAWQPPGTGMLELIPPDAFASDRIAQLPALGVKHAREFVVDSVGEVPLSESDLPLVRVQFRLVTARGATTRPRAHWDFGDGQTSSQTDPLHIYLHPGIYTVSMKAAGDLDAQAVVDKVPIHRPLIFADENHPPDKLGPYLALVEKYNPAKLDPTGLLQLIRAFDEAGLVARAVKAGQAGILAERAPMDSESALAAVRTVSGMLHDRLDDAQGARAFLEGSVRVLGPEAWKAECEVRAADLALHDLLAPQAAKKLLDSATARLGTGGDADVLSRLYRAWGDWHARKGDKAAACAAYARAMAAVGTRRLAVEQDAWRGAHSRSTEEFLRDKALDRAWTELTQWQDEYPIDKIEGYLTFLQARYWAARGKFPQAIALAGDLVVVNSDSPYADRLVFLAAECDEKLGRHERARAGYQSLLTDYPGSPLVARARQKLGQAGGKPAAATKKP
ncbi:MAG: PKD domain-containing protein [Isosphaeraceae bacterium]